MSSDGFRWDNPKEEKPMDEIEQQFKYHPPRPDQLPRYEGLRSKAKELAQLFVQYCPPSADRSAALRKLREAVMTANASIALEPTTVEVAVVHGKEKVAP